MQAGDPILVNARTNRVIPFTPSALGREPHADRANPLSHSADGWVSSMAKHYSKVCPPNLWRIHGQLYDLEPYLDIHPGGRIFLVQTRGSDCTESFECHHIRGVSAKLLEKYRVNDESFEVSTTDRFTYNESFRDIKRFVANYLQQEIKNPTGTTPTWAGVLYSVAVAQTLFVAHLAAKRKSHLLACVAGILLTGCWGVGHNQVHRGRSNNNQWSFLRYAMDLTGFSSYETTVTHALSHHQNANTAYDIEIFNFHDIGLYWLTNEKMSSHWLFRLGLFYLTAGFTAPVLFLGRLVQRIFVDRSVLRGDVVIPMALITYMTMKAGSVKRGLSLTFTMWYAFSSWFVPSSLSLHHSLNWDTGAPRCYHDGEPEDFQRDFAAHQIVSTLDHSVKLNHYFALVLFAHLNVHTVHHLFPTIDRSLHGPILEALLRENPGGFRELYLKRDKVNKNFWIDLLPSVMQFIQDRRFVPV